jgi:hypothetical protein
MLATFTASAQAIANASQSLNNMAVANKSVLDKTDEKKQATSKWLPSAVFLLKLLSAEDGWDTQGVPKITEFAEKLFGMKIFGATQQIRSKAHIWTLTKGLGIFLCRIRLKIESYIYKMLNNMTDLL